jgi:hypothetical protein
MVDLYRGYSEGLLADEEPTRFNDMYGTAATGLLLAPSAGISDLMGMAPNPARQGEYLPSFGANIREGNYLDAGLQALGGAGDVMMAGGALFPPAAAAGALMKAPRAASVASRSVDDLQKVLDIRSAQMELPPAERVQPSGQNPLFDVSPESYEQTASLMPQSETPVPRKNPEQKFPKGDRARGLVEKEDAIATRLAERMEPYLGTPAQYFYHTAPLLEKAKSLGVSEKDALSQISRFAENYAATSPRTMTEQNLRNASLVSAKQEAGVPLTEIIGAGSGGLNEKGYPMMIGESGIHSLLVDAVRSGGIDYNTNPKPATFAENVKGNLQGVTVDTHAVRGALDAMNEVDLGSVPEGFIKPEFREQYVSDPSSFDPAKMVDDSIASQMVDGTKKQTEYAVFSDLYKSAAKKLGVTPAEAQSLGWFGSGERTGLASELKTVVDLIDERVDVTAQLLGESKDKVYKDFLSGKIPLLSMAGAGLLAGGAAVTSTGSESDRQGEGIL